MELQQSSSPQPSPFEIVGQVVLVLFVLYVLLVLAEFISVPILRRRDRKWQEREQAARGAMANLQLRLAEQSNALGRADHEPPYKALYDDARKQIRQAGELAETGLADLESASVMKVPRLRMVEAFLVLPLLSEIVSRLRRGRYQGNVKKHLSTVQDISKRVDGMQEQIASMGATQKSALAAMRTTAQELDRAIAAEMRGQLPLTALRSQSASLVQRLDEIDRLLSGDNPGEEAVVSAYPIRLQAEKAMQELGSGLKAVQSQREQATKPLADATQQIEALRKDVAADVSAGFQHPRFGAVADALAQQLAGIQADFDSGSYEQVASACVDLAAKTRAETDGLRRLVGERGKALAAIDKAAQRLNEQKAWLAQVPGTFEMDASAPLVAQADQYLGGLRQVLIGEEIEKLGQLKDLDREFNAWMRKIKEAREGFSANLQAYKDAVRATNNDSVTITLRRADAASAALRTVNPRYWSDLKPEQLEQARAALESDWQRLSERMSTVRETELAATLDEFGRFAKSQTELDDLTAAVDKAVAVVAGDEHQARELLTGPQTKDLIEQIAPMSSESGDFGARANQFINRMGVLQGALQVPSADYRSIAEAAGQLQAEVRATVTDYQAQREVAEKDIQNSREQLAGIQAVLKTLVEDPRLDFEAKAAPAADAVADWLSQAASRPGASLAVIQASADAGRSLLSSARAARDELLPVQQAFDGKYDRVGRDVLSLGSRLDAAQRLLGQAAAYGSAGWRPDPLVEARDAVAVAQVTWSRAAQPGSKQAPDAAMTALDDIDKAVGDAGAKVSAAENRLRSTLEQLTRLDEQLLQKQERAGELAAQNEGLKANWEQLGLQVAAARESASKAVSPESAISALSQALASARQFTQAETRGSP